jgi:hypothetical protein
MRIGHVSHFHKHVENIHQLLLGITTECNDVFLYQVNHEDVNNKMLLAMFDVGIDEAVLFDATTKHDIAKQLLSYDVLFFHSLSKISIELINSLNEYNGIIVWIGWGYDYVDLMFDDFEEMLDEVSTKAYWDLKQSDTPTLMGISEQKQNAISKIDIFSPVLFEEFETVIERNAFCSHLIFADLMYGFKFSFDNIVSIGRTTEKTKTIWLGNSATIANNHLDHFHHFPCNSEYNYKIPLSYGFENYRFFLKAKLYESDTRIEYIEEFQAFKDYCKSIAQCEIMVMNHIRQQALGNIFIGLLVGCLIFIHKKSPALKFLKRCGFVVYSTSDLGNLGSIKEAFFSEQSAYHNTNIILNMFSHAGISQRAKSLFNLLNSIRVNQ